MRVRRSEFPYILRASKELRAEGGNNVFVLDQMSLYSYSDAGAPYLIQLDLEDGGLYRVNLRERWFGAYFSLLAAEAIGGEVDGIQDKPEWGKAL